MGMQNWCAISILMAAVDVEVYQVVADPVFAAMEILDHLALWNEETRFIWMWILDQVPFAAAKVTKIAEFLYSPKIEYSPPYYISPIDIGLIWAEIIYFKSHSKALAFGLQTDMK